MRFAMGERRGYRRRELSQSGLVKLRDEERGEGEFYDRFRGRLMFPICNDVGEVIAFSGRVLDTEATAAKYINSPETPLFRKGRVLFGLHKTKRALIDADCAIVCEGQLDLITLFEAGIHKCGRAAGNGVHGKPGACAETLRSGSGSLFRCRYRRSKSGRAFARSLAAK